MKVLILDDEHFIRQTLSDYLEDRGISTKEAGSAEEALGLLETEPFDACTVDMRLPGMDGNDFIHAAYRRWPDLRFLVYTGSTNYSLPGQLEPLYPSVIDLIQKPAPDLGAVVDALRKLKESV